MDRREQGVGHDPNGMRDVWCWALSWFLKPPASVEKRAMQAELVHALKQEIDVQLASRGLSSDAPGLHELYSQNSRWCLEIARGLYPRQWATLAVHATIAAAFGIRYVELMTGRQLNAREELPRWVGEWAIW